MRLDDLPTSDRIEDRRGRLPGGRAGLGIGTVVILGLLACDRPPLSGPGGMLV